MTRKTRILWFSPSALHDGSSGTAQQCRYMLEWLKTCYGNDYQIGALSAFTFASPSGSGFISTLTPGSVKETAISFDFTCGGIGCIYLKCVHGAPTDLSSAEQQLLYNRFLGVLDEFEPDIVMGLGGDLLSMGVRAEARRRGIKVVYYLSSGSDSFFSLRDCDLVLTDSQAAADFYRNLAGQAPVPVGMFYNPNQVIAPSHERDPQYVTFINPLPSKGLALFARLALMARRELPGQRFLVVQSRTTLARHLTRLYEPAAADTDRPAGQEQPQPDEKGRIHPLTAEMLDNVDVGEHSDHMAEVYAVTRVLLVPSLDFESWGRVATEAVLNGIPVLCSDSGGLAEASAAAQGCAACLEIPQSLLDEPLRLPTEEEVRPWLERLRELLTGDYASACEQAAAGFDNHSSARRVHEALCGLLGRSPDTTAS